jgi:hypothetical protein
MWTIVLVLLRGAIGVSFPFLEMKGNGIAARLAYAAVVEADERSPESQKRSHFEGIGFTNTEDVVTWLRVGVARNCDMFRPVFLLSL